MNNILLLLGVLFTLSASFYHDETDIISLPTLWTNQTRWLVNNGMYRGVPRSFDDKIVTTGKSFWLSGGYLREKPRDPSRNFTFIPIDRFTAIQERSKIHHGLNLYDGAIWSISLTLSGYDGIVDMFYKNVLYSSTTGSNDMVDGLANIRANTGDYFAYGPSQTKAENLKKVALPTNMSFVHQKDPHCCGHCCEFVHEKEVPGGYLYRIISPNYRDRDPISGVYSAELKAWPAGPNMDPSDSWNLAGELHWNDWKPLTPENVWAVMMAPMQTLFAKTCGKIPKFNSMATAPMEVQFAHTIMPALIALKSPLGAIYHCPKGTSLIPSDSDEKTVVTNEGTFSTYAALKAVSFVLANFYTGGDDTIDAMIYHIGNISKGLDTWMNTQLTPKPIQGEVLISSGGHISFGGLNLPYAAPWDFSLNSQIYGLLVMGSERFDQFYNNGQSYKLWQAVKKIAGFYDGNVLKGVGYTISRNFPEGSKVWSVESTFAAIAMCRLIGTEYINRGMTVWGKEFLEDAESMNNAVNQLAIVDFEGLWIGGGLQQTDGSYLYSNTRFFITNGWYANHIGSTVGTGWAILNNFYFNPFQLGGGFNTTFWKTQCGSNFDTDNMMRLAKFYKY